MVLAAIVDERCQSKPSRRLGAPPIFLSRATGIVQTNGWLTPRAVRRQLLRPFARPPEREEHVIRTMRPNDAVVDDLCAILSRG